MLDLPTKTLKQVPSKAFIDKEIKKQKQATQLDSKHKSMKQCKMKTAFPTSLPFREQKKVNKKSENLYEWVE